MKSHGSNLKNKESYVTMRSNNDPEVCEIVRI